MSNIEDIENIRSFLFELADGTKLKLVEKENYDKLVKRIKELEQENYIQKIELLENSIPKQKVKNKIKELEQENYVSKKEIRDLINERQFELQQEYKDFKDDIRLNTLQEIYYLGDEKR